MIVGSNESRDKAALEGFIHIVERIFPLWGHVGLDEYLDSLLISDRLDRAGFPSEVMVEIMFLQRIHHEILPPKETTIWDKAYGIR